MRGVIGRCWPVAGVMAVLAMAMPSSAAASELFAFSNTDATITTSSIAQSLGWEKSQYCDSTPPAYRALSLSAALHSVSHHLNSLSTRAARREFAHSGDARTEFRAVAAAAGATMASRPAAALVALVRAHKLAPGNPVPLIDAAPLLVDEKLPSEALAFLRAAQTMTQPASLPMGISAPALNANNQGFAWLALGRWSSAEKELRTAVKAAPLLSEAKTNLANALACEGKTQAAAQMMFLGARRDPAIGLDLVGETEGDPTPTQAGVDVEHGVQPTLPTYRYPKSILDGYRMYESSDSFSHLSAQASQDEQSLLNQQGSLSQALSGQEKRMSPASRRRTQSLIQVLGRAPLDSTVAKLTHDADQKYNTVDNFSNSDLGQQAQNCGPATHNAWLSAMKSYDTAERAELKALYHLETAVGANLKNPTAHALAMAMAKEDAQTRLVLILQQGAFLEMWDEQCEYILTNYQPPNEPPESTVQNPTDKRPPSRPCPSGVLGKGFQLNFPPGDPVVQLSVDCETVSLEVDARAGGEDGLGYLGAFANVSHNFRDGSTTVFAGPRAKSNPGAWGPNVNLKDGVYMTFDSHGAVQDLGGRIETGSELNAGVPGGATFSGESMNFSLAGASPIGAVAQLFN